MGAGGDPLAAAAAVKLATENMLKARTSRVLAPLLITWIMTQNRPNGSAGPSPIAAGKVSTLGMIDG